MSNSNDKIMWNTSLYVNTYSEKFVIFQQPCSDYVIIFFLQSLQLWPLLWVLVNNNSMLFLKYLILIFKWWQFVRFKIIFK